MTSTTAAGTTTSTIASLITGVDTDAIVQSLVTAAQGPENTLKTRLSTAQNQLTAYQSVGTDLAALQVLSSQVATQSGWGARAATSSNTSVATVTAQDSASLGSLSFTVDQLATSHSLVSQTSVASGSTTVASSGSVAITIGGQSHTISVGDGSLDEVVAGINNAKIGVTATEVNTGNGYRLQISANATGAAQAFTVDSGLDSNVGGMAIATQGQDAHLTVGSGAGAYGVTSSSNTFSSLLPNVSITAVSQSTSPVTITVSSDAQALATQVQNMVDAANKVISDIQSDTNYNTSTSTASVLTGDSTVERIQNAITNALTGAVGQSSLHSPAAAGLSMDATGAITFDQNAFISAYQANPQAVQSLFVQDASSSTPSMSFVNAGTTAQGGTAAVVVTQAATKATDTGLVGTWPLSSPPNIAVQVGTTSINYQVQANDTATTAAAGLQAAITAAGLPLTAAATTDGTGITLTSTGYGSGATFAVAWDGTNFSTDSGTDVAGTINGVTATGNGRLLSLPASDPTYGGLSIQMNDDSTGAVGSITYEPGLAQRVSTEVANATDSSRGYLVASENGLNTTINSLNSSISDMDLRVQALQTRLQNQYAALQATLSQLKDQSNYLTQEINSIPTIGGGSSSSSGSGTTVL